MSNIPRAEQNVTQLAQAVGTRPPLNGEEQSPSHCVQLSAVRLGEELMQGRRRCPLSSRSESAPAPSAVGIRLVRVEHKMQEKL